MNNLYRYTLEWLKVVAEFILYILIAVGIAIILMLLTHTISGTELGQLPVDDVNPYLDLFNEYLPLFIGSMVSLFITHQIILKQPWHTTGFVRRSALKGFTQGSLLAFIMILIGFIVLWSADLMRIDQIDWQPITFSGFFFFFLFQSSFEEIVCRSFLLPAIEKRFGVWLALIVSSLFFTLVHGSNPNVNWIGLLNIFFAGLLLGMLFVMTRSIWAPIGLHFLWNFLQGTVFGYEVSGLEVYSLLNTTETGNDYLTGGAFGYEGSILALISLIVGCILVYRNKPSAFVTLSIYSRTESNQELHV